MKLRARAAGAVFAILTIGAAALAQITGMVTFPGGTNGQLQYHSDGTFEGVSGSSVSGSSVTVGEIRASTGAFGAAATKSTFSATGALTMAANAGITLSGAAGTIVGGSSITTAGAFFGDGSKLTGIPSTAAIAGADAALAAHIAAHSVATSTHGATAANTADRIVLRDGSGNFAAGTITAALSGNATTASALAANGANCSSGNAPLGVDAAGAVENCFDVGTQAELDGVLASRASSGTDNSLTRANALATYGAAGTHLSSETFKLATQHDGGLSATTAAFTGSGSTWTVVTSSGMQVNGELNVTYITERSQAVGNTGTAFSVYWASGTASSHTLTGNATITFVGVKANTYFTLVLKQDGTGSRTVTWPAAVKWPANTAPTLTTTALRRDIFSFWSMDGVEIFGFVGGQDFHP